MTKLADFMTLDPFDEPPIQEEVADGGALHRAVRRVLPTVQLAPDTNVLITNRTSGPKYVIDAKPTGVCRACGAACWISPSSLTIADPVVVCVDCLAPALDAEVGAEMPRGRA